MQCMICGVGHYHLEKSSWNLRSILQPQALNYCLRIVATPSKALKYLGLHGNLHYTAPKHNRRFLELPR